MRLEGGSSLTALLKMLVLAGRGGWMRGNQQRRLWGISLPVWMSMELQSPSAAIAVLTALGDGNVYWTHAREGLGMRQQKGGYQRR